MRCQRRIAPQRNWMRERVQVQLDLDEAANGPLANLIQLPGLGALTVHLQLAGPRDALATQLRARAGDLQAGASGTLDLPGSAATLDLTLQAPAMTPRAGLSWQRVSLRAHAQGAFTAPTTSAHLELAGLSPSARCGSIHCKPTYAGEGQALALEAMLGGLSLPAPVTTLLHAPIAVQGPGPAGRSERADPRSVDRTPAAPSPNSL